MRAKLRTWMGSWQVWVIVACLAYIGGIYGRGPAIGTVWPAGLRIAQWLLLLALIVLGWTVGDVLARYIVVPFLTRLQGKKITDRTIKAQEKFADSLMSVSTAIASAVFIGVLVFPLTVFIQTIGTGKDPLWALWSWLPGLLSRGTKPEWWPLLFAVMFVGLYFWPLVVAQRMREWALKIYDTLPPSALAVAPTAQGTNEQPRIPAEVRTTPASVHVDARRRRRPRVK